MTRPISDLDVPLTELQEQLRELLESQRRAVAEVPDDRHLQALSRPVKTTPEEAS